MDVGQHCHFASSVLFLPSCRSPPLILFPLKQPMETPLPQSTIYPAAPTFYYEPRERFSLLKMAKNPYYLMIAATIGMVWLLPKMREWVDAEELTKQYMELKAEEEKRRAAAAAKAAKAQ
jgi:hypothetical protein